MKSKDLTSLGLGTHQPPMAYVKQVCLSVIL